LIPHPAVFLRKYYRADNFKPNQMLLAHGSKVVKALGYKPEGQGFEIQ
jgi:hypothetical protein